MCGIHFRIEHWDKQEPVVSPTWADFAECWMLDLDTVQEKKEPAQQQAKAYAPKQAVESA